MSLEGFWKPKTLRQPPWVRNKPRKNKVTDWPLDCFGRIIEEELTDEQREILEESKEKW